MKMHAVLGCWQRGPFERPLAPRSLAPDPSVLGPCKRTASMPCDEWNTCFSSIASVYWYHAYVYEVIGEDSSAGFSESNVQRTYDALNARGDTDVGGRLALLDILKLVYRYNYRRV
jgi:hypothetical protein